MSFYVRRIRLESGTSGRPVGEVGWVGPIRSERQAGREKAAWEADGNFSAEVVPSSQEVRAEVREWTKGREERHQAAMRVRASS